MILSIMLWFNILESSNVAKHDAEHLPIVMIIEKRVKCSYGIQKKHLMDFFTNYTSLMKIFAKVQESKSLLQRFLLS